MLFGRGRARNMKFRTDSQSEITELRSESSIQQGAGSGVTSRVKSRARSWATSANRAFHGVQIKARDDKCCGAVEALEGQRFLTADSPLLPLTECTNPRGCRCVYEHFDERRDNLRRESDIVVASPVDSVGERLSERRAGRGRRRTDG